MTTIRQALLEGERALEAVGVPDPRIDAEWLLAHATGLERMTLRLNGADELTKEQEQRFASLLLSRAQRQPLQYLLGCQGFYGLDIRTDARALIPRQETETLCETGVRHLRALGRGAAPAALDLCTGSGAIALAVKHECPFAAVSACDKSADALALARENAARLGLDVAFTQGDLFEAVGGTRFDLILSNPPYIPTETCGALQPEVMQEPRMALDGGADGLDFYRRIADGAMARLTPRGLLAVEVGDGQAEDVRRLFTAAGLARAGILNDLYGHARVVLACHPCLPHAIAADPQGGTPRDV